MKSLAMNCPRQTKMKCLLTQPYFRKGVISCDPSLNNRTMWPALTKLEPLLEFSIVRAAR